MKPIKACIGLSQIKSVTLNGIVCNHCVHRIEHHVWRIEHPVPRKYPIMYVLLGVVPSNPFRAYRSVKKNQEKCNFVTPM